MVNTAKKTAYYGTMLAVAMIFSYIESLLVIPMPVPGIKLGLCNLIIVIILYKNGPAAAFIINISRILLAGLLFGNVQSVIFSLAGGLLSLALMCGAKRVSCIGITGVSMLGGAAHGVGQIAAAAVMLSTAGLVYYLPFLIAAGTIAGFFIGFMSGKILPRLERF